MRSARLYRYVLPLDESATSVQKKLGQREGFIVELRDGQYVGKGEIAPLADQSFETIDEVYPQLVEQLILWQKRKPIDINSLYPSVAFGLSIAELDLSGTLPSQGCYHVVPVTTGEPDELASRLELMHGNKIAKIKVGHNDPYRDGIIVSSLLSAIPDLSLRLDANRAWNAEKASQFAKKIAPSLRGRIEFIEEPCESPGDSFSFAINTGIAVAWDETLLHAMCHEAFKLEDLNGAKAIILKPTLTGSIERCIELIERAKELGIKVVISSSLESSVGLNQLARFSRWQLPSEVPALDTIGIFTQQIETGWPGCTLPIKPLSEHALVWQSA
ncbi:o-succinylbenzoate synthase [Vibrio caribbeanicus]|uniref:o-succinylbenzoate synthase n=1 Tax=Vibrio caribbeanicus ATCC BAA-2122 TaxID=796620 RepID=E3BHQ0_9VIBR|nr:o-succinylbenzoate synthase [Vibrio caribbeanicus]EFP97339.1 O-succinylbenzoate synthase [Vibrio caribbeanicus ATCC BAA-2122]